MCVYIFVCVCVCVCVVCVYMCVFTESLFPLSRGGQCTGKDQENML